jgi:hypothetical protein
MFSIGINHGEVLYEMHALTTTTVTESHRDGD